jgi:hypothetical protein
LEGLGVVVAGGAGVLTEEGGDDAPELLDVLRCAGVEGVLDERVLGAGRTAE